MTFRTRLFLTSLATTALTLVVATSLASWSIRRSIHERIERTLVGQTRLAAEALARAQAPGLLDLDAEADTLGRLVGARVTLVSADGQVVGDSDLDTEQLKMLDNHAERPEGTARPCGPT